VSGSPSGLTALAEITALLPDITLVGVAEQLTTGSEALVIPFSSAALNDALQPVIAKIKNANAKTVRALLPNFEKTISVILISG
jgi:hypothetical protein